MPKRKRKYKYFTTERDTYSKNTDGISYKVGVEEVVFTSRRVNVKGKYKIRTYQVLNPENRRKRGYKPVLKLVDTRKGSTFKETRLEIKRGKILSEHRRERVGAGIDGKFTYEYLSKKSPRTTPKKKYGKDAGENYKIQFIGYFQAVYRNKSVVVMGYSDGYFPGGPKPPKDQLIIEAEKRARYEAFRLIGNSDFDMTLVEGGYRYHSYQ